MKLARKFQMGGEVQPAAPQGGGMGPEEQLVGLAQEIIQSMGPEGAAMLAQIIMEMLQGMAQEAAPQEAPMYARQGGRLVRMVKR